MPSVPSWMCQSISLRKASRSRAPSSCIGVTIATRLPCSVAIYKIFREKGPVRPGLNFVILPESCSGGHSILPVPQRIGCSSRVTAVQAVLKGSRRRAARPLALAAIELLQEGIDVDSGEVGQPFAAGLPNRLNYSGNHRVPVRAQHFRPV